MTSQSKSARLLAGLLVFGLVMAAGAAYATRKAGGYSATAVVAISPRGEVAIGGDMVELSAQKYTAYVPSSAAMSEAEQASGLTYDELIAVTSATVEPQTANLAITVHHASASTASDAAQALADAVVERAASDEQVVAEVIRPSTPDTVETGQSLVALMGLAALLALVAGALTWAVLSPRRDHYVSETKA